MCVCVCVHVCMRMCVWRLQNIYSLLSVFHREEEGNGVTSWSRKAYRGRLAKVGRLNRSTKLQTSNFLPSVKDVYKVFLSL